MKTNNLIYKTETTYIEDSITYKMIVEIKLNDERKNGHCDFAMTCNGYEKTRSGRWADTFGGCCHDEILKQFPELEIFAKLHLCNNLGMPMYMVENGFYFVKERNRQALKDYFTTATDQEIEKLMRSEDRDHFKYLLFCETDIISKQKELAAKAIKQLEALTGKEFEDPYKLKCEYKEDEKAAFLERLSSGYYTKEAKQERANRIKKAKEDEINEYYNKEIAKLELNRKIDLYMLGSGFSKSEFIYYDHSNTITFGWRNTAAVEESRFEAFKNNFDKSIFPDGVKIELEYAK